MANNTTEIRYGGYVFSLAKLYRVSPLVENQAISGKVCWVKSLAKHNLAGDRLVCDVVGLGEYLITPYYVVPA